MEVGLIVDNVIAGAAVQRGDRVELVRKGTGRYRGRVVSVSAQALTIRVDYADRQSDIQIPRSAISELQNLGRPEGDPEMPDEASGIQAATIQAYVEANLDRFTPDVVSASLMEAGHDPVLVASIIAQVTADRATAPIRSRARRAIVALYGLTYVGLTALFLLTPAESSQSSLLKTLGPILLVPELLVALGAALLWAGRRRPDIGFLARLSVPLILLVGVGGACVAYSGGTMGWIR